MKTIIPCKITYSAEDNCWYIEAPGIYSGLATYGDSLDHAKEMASEALTGLLESIFDSEQAVEIPPMPDSPNWYGIEPAANVAFAIWLRSRRKAAGMTLTDVAEQLGIKYQACQKLENPATANPSLKTLAKLEKVFKEHLIAV